MKKRDRNNCLFYYGIMKILQIISIIGILLNPIKTDRYKTITNNTNQLIFDGSQVSYTYTCEEVGATVGGSIAGFVGAEVFVPSVFVCNICIQLLQPVDFANINMTFTMPVTNNYHLNYIMENARVVTSSRTQLSIQAFNTDTVNVKLYFSINQLLDDYYFSQANALDYSEEWVLNGSNYFDIISIQLNSATQYTDPNYSTQLTSLMNNTDSIESLLQSIVTNTNRLSTTNSTLSTISSNISSINTTLTNIKNSLTYIINGNELYNSLMFSLDHRVDNIQNVLDRNIVEFYEGDYVTTGSGPSQQSVFITLWDSENHINDTYDRNKLKLVFVLYDYFDCPYYYLDVPIYQSNPNGTIYQQLYLIKQKTYVVCIQAAFKVSQTKTEYFLGVNLYTLSTGNLSSSSARSTNIYKTILTDASITTNQKLDDLINIINNEWNISVDTTDKTSVDNWYHQLKQSLDFPNIDQQELTQGFQKMGKIIKYYGMLINNSNWILFPKIILISAMFKLFGVIIS